MSTQMNIAVLSGRRMDQGKTSIVDNLIAPRIDNLVRVEIESASTGSSKDGVNRIPASQLPKLREAILDLDDDQSLVCDVGGAEYGSFMAEITKYASTAAEFHRFLFVMRCGPIKEADALESISELLQMGAKPSQVSVVFNCAPYQVGLDRVRASLREEFRNVFEKAEQAGFHVCETPIVEAIDLYKTVFGSSQWSIDSLASAPNLRDEIKALKRAGQEVPDTLRQLELAQENARSFAKANLDAVWSEIVAAQNLGS